MAYKVISPDIGAWADWHDPSGISLKAIRRLAKATQAKVIQRRYARQAGRTAAKSAATIPPGNRVFFPMDRRQ
jgi:hypothetical protein